MDASETQPSPPKGHAGPRLLPVIATIALALSLLTLVSLRSGDTAPTQTDTANAGLALPLVGDSAPLLGGGGLPLAGAVPLVGGAAPAAPAAAPAAAQKAASAKAIDIMGYKYAPAAMQIAAGDSVTWTNHDTAAHNVVISAGPEKFTSPTLQTGQSFTFTFTKAGSYSYYCALHPDMKASVAVEGAAPTTTPTTTTAPTATSTTGHPMPTTPTTPGTTPCMTKDSVAAIMAHVKAAHLERNPLLQVTDILAADQYVLTHTVWLENVLSPVFNGTADQTVRDTLAPIMAHIKSAHLEKGLFEQVADILAIDQYVKSHLVWLESVVAPLASQLTC